MPPQSVLEVSLFGPQYGESLVIHIGDGRWIIIDSCLDPDTKRPAALKYLEELGVDTSTAVELVLITHWHDDHIRGATQVVNACKVAKIAISNALTSKEFLETIETYSKNAVATPIVTGVSEIRGVLNALVASKRAPKRLSASQSIYFHAADTLSHGLAVQMVSLSPSDHEVQRAIERLANDAVVVGTTKTRMPTPTPNDLSVASWLAVGDQTVLLGADLEENGDENLGWSAALNVSPRPGSPASAYKVAHHGSETGHHEGIWETMLEDDAVCILTTWNKGSKLPTQEDIARLRSLASRVYVAASGALPKKKRAPMVEKQIREMGVKITSTNPKFGQIRLRRDANDPTWKIELLGSAVMV